MDRLLPLLVEIWRAVGQPSELQHSLARAAPAIADRLPLGLLLIREIDLAARAVETLALHDSAPERSTLPSRSELAGADLDVLLAWSRGRELAHSDAERIARQLPCLLPEGVAGDVVALPLAESEGAGGLLIAVARAGSSFGAADEALLRALLEPFAAALANHRRLHALAALREAAQADRAALLSRLGRTELGETIVGAEAGFAPVMQRVGLVAGLDVPVLVLGETGSGKEVVARAIHARSRRAAGPFLRVNCGAIPAGLIDSELFGHERGSFTGALGERRGWFERADRGTLFLDEIGELPAEAQVRLLRVLQDHTLERVGGHRSLPVDVRLVAATHRDLQGMIAEGRFREDLWYRIAIFPIHLPPLRERAEDIPALAHHFALRAATRFGMPPRLPAPEDLELLLRYAWPGNVRELGAVMDRAVILGGGERLEVATALGVGTASREPRAAAAPRGAGARAEAGPFPTLDAAMAQHIAAALARCGGRIEGRGGAAELLEINPHTLRARMRKLGVDWRSFRARQPA